MFKTNRFMFNAVILVMVTFTQLSIANESEIKAKKWNEECIKVSKDKSTSVYFKELADKLHKEKLRYCRLDLSNNQSFPFSLGDSFDYLFPYNNDPAKNASIKIELEKMAVLNQYPQIGIKDEYKFEVNMEPREVVEASRISECNKTAESFSMDVKEATCAKALKEFVDIFNAAQKIYALSGAFDTKKHLDSLTSDWTKFLDYSRSQTPLELLINGMIYKYSEKETFRKPPGGQWIFLHPGVVIENVSDAIDGEQTNEAIALDVLGYNWWKQDSWYIPSGISYTKIYADRNGIKDWGDGISLHFKSKFTIGYSKHGDAEGIYISVDLLELFKDRKKIFSEYRSDFSQ
jgi:hypothetical protein